MSENAITTREEDSHAQSSVGVHTPVGKGQVVAEYDFARQGGVIGTITLAHDPLPVGAIVTNTYLEVLTALAGASATAAVQIESADDIVAATAISGAPWNTTGRKDALVEPGDESTYIKTTELRQLALLVATADLTAGRFKVIIEYDGTGV